MALAKKKSMSRRSKLAKKSASPMQGSNLAFKLPEPPESYDDFPILDTSLLLSIRSLSKGQEKDFLNSLIALFFDRTPTLLKAIHEGLDRGDAHAFERASHALKGTSGNLGATRMSRMCETLEIKGKGQNLNGAEEILDEIEKLYSEVKLLLEKGWIV